MLPDSPIRKLAFPQFIKQFGDLISPNGQVTPYEASLVAATYELAFIGHYSSVQHSSIRNTVRVALKIMEQGSSVDFNEVASAFLLNSERTVRQMNRVWGLIVEGREIDDASRRIETLLRLYKTLYEGLTPALLAPVVVALGLSAGSKEDDYRLDRDGRVRLSALHTIQYYSQYPNKQLSIGLNSHVRNAYSHDRYTLLDGGKVELWDVDPRTGQLSWGPETWSAGELDEFCQTLWKNCLGLTYAYALFSINSRQLMEQAGIIATVQPLHDPVTSEELNSSTTYLAKVRGFEIQTFSYTNGLLSMRLKTGIKGIDQDSEIVVGHERGGVSRYVVPMHYLELPLIDQLLGLLQEVQHQLVSHFRFDVTVVSPEDADLGQLVGDTVVLPHGKKIPLDELRKRFDRDSIINVKIPVLFEGYPRQVQ